MQRQALTEWLDALLSPGEFEDYCPNGLQVEGADQIQRVAFAVSATADSIAQAVEGNADALIVHHGLFWKFHGAKPITGAFANRVKPLIHHEINLYGFHLPLDAHPQVGNNAGIANELGLVEQRPFGDFKGSAIGIGGHLSEPLNADAVRQRLAEILSHEVLMASPDPAAMVNSVGVISGGANNEWTQAVDAGFDAYVTGEMSEHNWHEAKEAGMHMYAGGHNATERFGVQALMAKMQDELGLSCWFIPSENPA